MAKRIVTFAFKRQCIIVFCFMLMICKVFAANTESSESYAQFIERVEALQGVDARDALRILENYAPNFDSLTLSQQLTFLRLKAEVYMDLAQHKQTKYYANQGLALAKKLTSPSLVIADLAYSRGYAYESLGDLKQAQQDYIMGLDVARSLNDKSLIAMGLINLGAVYYQTQAYEHSLTMLNSALTIANELDDTELLGYVYSELGILYAMLGKYEQSITFYQQSYQSYSEVGMHSLAINSLRNIASHYSGAGEYEKSITANAKIINEAKIAKTTINDEIMLTVHTGMAWAQIKKENPDPEAAYYYLEAARKYLVNIEYPSAKFDYALSRAFVLYNLKKYNEALEAANIADSYFELLPKHLVSLGTLDSVRIKADIYFELGQFEQAYQLQSKLIEAYAIERAKHDNSSVDNLRLKYESQQADLTKKLIERKMAVQNLTLQETQAKNNQQNWLLGLACLAIFSLAVILFKLIKSQRLLIFAAHTDPLTVINNRGRILELIQEAVSKAHQNNLDTSILMIDIDHFKRVNDSFGHQSGDIALKRIVACLSENLRNEDALGRYGGEEFIVLLPQTYEEQAVEVAERLRCAVEKLRWSFQKDYQVTISIGIASSKGKDQESFSALIKRADDYLYQAKQTGRNKVCV